MFMPLNKATIGIIYTIVFPCKVGAIDGRIRNFTQTTIHPTKSRNSLTKRPKWNKRNEQNETTVTNKMKLNKRNDRNDKNETMETKRTQQPYRNDRNDHNEMTETIKIIYN